MPSEKWSVKTFVVATGPCNIREKAPKLRTLARHHQWMTAHAASVRRRESTIFSVVFADVENAALVFLLLRLVERP